MFPSCLLAPAEAHHARTYTPRRFDRSFKEQMEALSAIIKVLTNEETRQQYDKDGTFSGVNMPANPSIDDVNHDPCGEPPVNPFGAEGLGASRTLAVTCCVMSGAWLASVRRRTPSARRLSRSA